jgi:uncharacterized protein with von Willebrand factor type A (vWA) domain
LYASVSKALSAAKREIDDFESFQRACGTGDGSGGQIEMEEVKKSFQKVKNNHQLRRIMELAGRYRLSAQAKQRQKVHHGYDDMVGVQMAGDIGKLLPIELAKLADEDLELDTMRRIVENQAMCRQYRGIEKVGKGPIIVCVDESGSMNGDPIAQAKALALAMYWIAKHQNRWCMLASFSHGTRTVWETLVPGKPNTGGLLFWLEHFYNGGTSLDVPCTVIPEGWESINPPRGKTDMIIITDAQVGLPHDMKEKFLAWKKKEKVRTIGLLIGVSHSGAMSAILDEEHCIGRISVDSNAVNSCLSI